MSKNTNPELDAISEIDAINHEPDPMMIAEQQQRQQPQPPEYVVLQFDTNELNIVFSALQELPHRVVDPILKKIVDQAQRQLN